MNTGDSFTIGPTAHNAFRNWPDLAKRSEEIAYRPLFARHAITGERLTEPIEIEKLMSSCNDEGGTSQLLLRHSRPKFHAALLEQAEKVGINVEYGCEVIEYLEDIENCQASVKLKDGKHFEADLVIAADGIGGKSWPLVAGHPVPARSSGRGFFRVAYPVDYALADPVIAERFPLIDGGKSVMEQWSG